MLTARIIRNLITAINVAIIVVVILAFTIGCGGGETYPPVPPGRSQPVNLVQWERRPDIGGTTGNYASLLFTPAGIRVYSNTNGQRDGALFLREGDELGVGPARQVLRVDDARDAYIRTSAIAQLPDGSFVAILYTGDGYPTQGGYSPSLATSPDGRAWTWRGPIGIFGRFQSSAGALLATEAGCEAWTDGTGLRLRRYSAPLPCTDWTADLVEQWPASLPDDGIQFCTAARTLFGTHIHCANGFPASRWRHLFRPNGAATFCVIEDASVGNPDGKGVALAYDARTGLLHALAQGEHWTTPAKAFAC